MKSLEELEKWLLQPEKENLEFKEAKASFSFEDEVLYCAALANEGGGKLILGVKDKKINGERPIVGTQVHIGDELYKLPLRLYEHLKIRIEVEELQYTSLRIVIYHVPSHPPGRPVRLDKKSFGLAIPSRFGESLHEMDDDGLKKIYREVEADFSSEIISQLKVSDLDQKALQKIKDLWSIKSAKPTLAKASDKNALQNLGLQKDEKITYAALILLGKEEWITQLLPCAEIIFEWRQDSNQVACDFRKQWRGPFILAFEDIWEAINARNIRYALQEGFIQRDIWSFDKKAIREAILNAVTHRDYQKNSGSIFIKASPKYFSIQSPGGFIAGITVDNILYKSEWRNRRLAEALQHVGLIERSGQGIDDIFEITVRSGKGLPDFSQSDEFTVRLNIPAHVEDPQFISFLEKIANDKQITFSLDQVLELERMRKEQKIKDPKYKQNFLHLGIIERQGKGKGTYYILSHRYYIFADHVGKHSRLMGLGRDVTKALILQHIERNGKAFTKDLVEALKDSKPKDVYNLLQDLKRDNKIEYIGKGPAGFWILHTEQS